jgi:hypothetical protein
MRGSERSQRAKWLWLLAALLLAACVRSNEPSELGGESHFLRRCSDRCGAGLDCIQGVCTRGCVVGKDSCGDLSADALCTADSVEPGEVAVCDLACGGDGDCAALSASHRCDSGYCRARASTASAGSANFPYPSDEVFVCPDKVTSDPITVLSGVVLGDELVLRVAYGGGCKKHELAVCFGPDFREEVPVGTNLRVLHEANDDGCEAGLEQDLRMSLKPLGDEYRRAYRANGGLIDTNYGRYAFGVLSCDDREAGAYGQLASFEREVARACQVDGDCVRVSNNTACTAGCGTVVSKAGATQLAEWIQVTNTAVCGDYEADGCGPVLVPPCVPPMSPACVSGTCQ